MADCRAARVPCSDESFASERLFSALMRTIPERSERYHSQIVQDLHFYNQRYQEIAEWNIYTSLRKPLYFVLKQIRQSFHGVYVVDTYNRRMRDETVVKIWMHFTDVNEWRKGERKKDQRPEQLLNWSF